MHYLNAQEAHTQNAHTADTYYTVHHPRGTFPPEERIPLCPKRESLTHGLQAVFMDMDGTTTTTEALCILGMRRALEGILAPEDAHGANAITEADEAQLIGHNLTTNLRFIHGRFANHFQPDALFDAYVEATLWLQAHSIDPNLVAQLPHDYQALGLGGLWGELNAKAVTQAQLQQWRDSYACRLQLKDPECWIRIGASLYYRQYHDMLRQFDLDVEARTATAPILPLPGLGYWQALLKGCFTPEAAVACAPWLGATKPLTEFQSHLLNRMARYFQTHPVRVALVTSSLRAEADIVLREVFRVLRREVEAAGWPTPVTEALLECYATPEGHYDAIVTASDAYEGRLKPHRDLYAIALSRVGLGDASPEAVLGLEDTLAGVVALRAAGIGMACALPFEGTINQNFDAAAAVCYGGLPEVILTHHAFLPPALLAAGASEAEKSA